MTPDALKNITTQCFYTYTYLFSDRALVWPVLCVSVRKLLQAGVKPDVTNEDGLTALHQVPNVEKQFIPFLETIMQF